MALTGARRSYEAVVVVVDRAHIAYPRHAGPYVDL